MKVAKDEIITIRCTRKEKERIKRKAEEKNKNVGNYMLDAAFAGLERRSSKDKKRIVRMIVKQENLIQLLKRLEAGELETEEISLALRELIEGEKEEWLYL